MLDLWKTYWFIDHDDEKVRDHCYVTGKFRGAAHWDCNINIQLTKKVPVIFHILRGHDSHLILDELKNCDVKIDIIPNVLEKYMVFFLNKNLVFDSMQLMNTSLEKLLKNLTDIDFKYLTEEFGSKNLELFKQKGAYPDEYMNSFKRFKKKNCLTKMFFTDQQKMEQLMMMVKN